MSHRVFELTPNQVSKTLKQLEPQAISHRNPNALTVAKIKVCTVTLYTSGKLLIQGEAAEQVARDLGFGGIAEQDTKPLAGQPDQTQLRLIGSDEVGNGSYFGGLAVVASLVTPSDHAWLRQLGVGDSKTLTDQKIKQLAPLLQEKIPHKALLLTPEKYNQVVGDKLRHNTVSVKVALHNQAIFLLLQEVGAADAIVIDAFTSESNYRKYLTKETNQFDQPINLIQKAEGQYLAVAVSSIIARNLFLDNLDKLSQLVSLTLPSGAGTASDKVASQLLKQQGIDKLAKVAKLHFKNTKKAYDILKKG